MSSPVRVRFAPSPTGYLHVGGARTALFNWLYARRNHGTFVLRIEDTDAARNTEEALAAIYDGLRWLGIHWDEGPDVGGAFGPYRQSERNAIYARHLDSLLSSGRAYEDGGAIRLRSPRQRVSFHDQILGPISIDRSQENDTALRRSDGSYIFHFVNVVDDIEMGITHVFRGEDHVMNTPKHIEIFEALGAPLPVFAHMPLILNMDGSKMSKRDQGSAVGWYQDQGFLPEAVRNFLCLLGWSPKDDRTKLPIDDVIALFDWDHLNHSAAKFDIDKCLWLNAQYLAELPANAFAAAARAHFARHGSRWLDLPADRLDAALALAHPKVKGLPELDGHLTMLFDDAAPIEPEARDKVLAKPATLDHLEAVAAAFDAHQGPWSADTIKQSVQATADSLQLKIGALLFPLRVALTGASHGVDLMPALELLGRETVVPRLRHRLSLLRSA
jgi:glutamyl-tRNA synthetase